MARIIAAAQGVYYLLTALWAIVDIDSFQSVTGEKTDLWLVKTVAAMLVAVGMALLAGSWRRSVVRETAVLGVTSALALFLVDVLYALGGEISSIYLLDGAAELMIILAWGLSFSRGRPD